MAAVEPAHDDQPEHDPVAAPPHALAEPAPEPPREPANPAVALLKSMFPDFDEAVIQSVLESVGGNQDAAVDVLLGMSDPSYVSNHQTPQPTEPQSTLELDEALARQLQLEDDRQHAESQQRPRGQSWRSRRNSHEAQQQQQQQSPGQSAQGTGVGPDLNEIKETLNQMAESGKRTFSSIVSRAKAKINEYQQARPSGAQQQQQPQSQQHPPPSWGSTPVQGTPSSAASFPNYYHETQQPVDRHTASQAYARYYTPADGSPDLGLDDGWQQISRRGRRSDEKPLEQPPHEAKGYDLDTPDLSAASTVPSAAVSAANTPAVPPAGPAAPAAVSEPEPTIPSVPSPSTEIPRPPATQAGSPLNAAKFGLLPKRPVSLLTPQASGAHPVAREASVSEDDEDELDYVENPFEDKH